MGVEVEFLPADKRESFLQVDDSITLVVHCLASAKFRKQQVCNIFVISQG